MDLQIPSGLVINCAHLVKGTNFSNTIQGCDVNLQSASA